MSCLHHLACLKMGYSLDHAACHDALQGRWPHETKRINGEERSNSRQLTNVVSDQQLNERILTSDKFGRNAGRLFKIRGYLCRETHLDLFKMAFDPRKDFFKMFKLTEVQSLLTKSLLGIRINKQMRGSWKAK